MRLDDLSEQGKDMLYQGLVEQEQFMEGFPYLRLPDKEEFFGVYNPTKRPSLLKRLYHTFF